MSSYSYQSRNALAAASPLRSMPLFKPVERVMGWSEAQKVAFTLDRARAAVDSLVKRYASDCAALGECNRVKHPNMRRQWQAKAMRQINQTRASLRAARAALVAAELAATVFATARA
jgi:hypothetical protein